MLVNLCKADNHTIADSPKWERALLTTLSSLVATMDPCTCLQCTLVHGHNGSLYMATRYSCTWSQCTLVHGYKVLLYMVTMDPCTWSQCTFVHGHNGSLYMATRYSCTRSQWTLAYGHNMTYQDKLLWIKMQSSYITYVRMHFKTIEMHTLIE